MFTVVSLERPHSIAFKCTPEPFAELIERQGIIPAPYLARHVGPGAGLGEVLDRRELTQLLHGSYQLVVAKLPKKRQEIRRKPASAPDVKSIRLSPIPRTRRTRITAGRPARQYSQAVSATGGSPCL